MKDKVTQYLLFLVFPLGALTLAVANIRSVLSRNIIWLYCGFFGFTFVISSPGIDAAVYKYWFTMAHDSDSISLKSILNDPNLTDYFVHITNYVVSRFTGDYRVLFLIFGLIFGYFYASNIHLVVSRMNQRMRWPALIFLLLFAFVIPFWNINGIRFYLAAHILFYAAGRYILSGDKWSLLWLALTPFVHFSYFFISGLYIVYMIFGRYRLVVLSIISAALLLGGLGFEELVPYIPDLDGAVGSKMHGYTHEEFVENMGEMKQTASWFLYLREDMLNYVIGIYSLYFMIFHDRILQQYRVRHLVYFGLLMISFSIFLNVIPTMSRMMYIGHLFIAGGFSIVLNQIRLNYWMRRLVPVYSVAILFFIIVEIRIGLGFIGIGSFFNNPLLMAFFDYTHYFGQYFLK
ncbi:MAG: EpsG family protein [Saprospiraceae bacterium]|nr:EpsG family protein [Saprospiraceae bacterium]